MSDGVLGPSALRVQMQFGKFGQCDPRNGRLSRIDRYIYAESRQQQHREAELKATHRWRSERLGTSRLLSLSFVVRTKVQHRNLKVQTPQWALNEKFELVDRLSDVIPNENWLLANLYKCTEISIICQIPCDLYQDLRISRWRIQRANCFCKFALVSKSHLVEQNRKYTHPLFH
jgi:hypothetical protein